MRNGICLVCQGVGTPEAATRPVRPIAPEKDLRYGPYLDGARDGHPGSAQRYANRRTEDALF
jgi:hypothetical protein